MTSRSQRRSGCPRRFGHLLALFVIVASLSRSAASSFAAPPDARPVEQIRRVLIISIDGLRPDLLLRADAPNMRKLLSESSYSLWARTTPVSITLPSHVSMLTGVTPEAHGITWNGDMPFTHPVYPSVPTLFQLAKRAGYSTAMAAGKVKFNTLARPGSLDYLFVTEAEHCESPEVTAHALQILREHKPDVLFVHLPSVDNVGHAKGWGSPEQLASIAQADGCVGEILSALDELKAGDVKLSDQTLLIISSDHGGAGRTHGPEDVRSRTIPWIARGPGVRKNFDLTRIADLDVQTYDTFATAAAVLGIPVERKVKGRFVSQILENQELLTAGRAPATAPTTAPTTQASSE